MNAMTRFWPIKFPVKTVLVSAVFTLMSGCSNMTIEGLARDTPTFDFREYFQGHTRASGWFSDRFGKPRRHFCGDFIGTDRNGKLELDETLYYSDNVVESRIWLVELGPEGNFSATSDSLIGEATGEFRGNTLAMDYNMRVKIAEGKEWVLAMKDFMMLQPDHSLHNITQVYKWGIRIGTVSTQYVRHDGTQTCSEVITRQSGFLPSVRGAEKAA